MRHLAVVLAALAVASACSRDDDALGVERVDIDVGAGRPINSRWSPDGKRLAYAKPVDGMAAIFVAAADGSNPVRLTNGVWDVLPVWSPDGQWIAYHAESPDHDLWVVSANGGEPRALTATRTDDVPVAWLPDASGVVYRQSGAGATRTMLVPLNGGAPRAFGPALEGNLNALPSPDGRWIAVTVSHGGQSTIWVQDTAAGTPRQLTTEGFEELASLRPWSSDSRYLAYTSRRSGATDLWVADVNTGELRQVTQDVRDDFDGVWSPDGRWLAFVSRRGGQNDVWIVSSAGGQPRRVTADRGIEADLQWAPDGQSLLFHRSEASSAVEVIPLDGGAVRQLFSWPATSLAGGTLSPDGRTLAFQADRSGVQDIWTVSLDGGEPTAVVNSPMNDVLPRWSPDGRMIAFMSDRGGTADIWVASASGGEPQRLTDWPSAETWPVWSPDGSTIAFTSNRDASRMEIWTIPAAGGEATRVTRTSAAARFVMWSPDGRQIFYVGATESGLHGLFSVPATGGTPRSLGVDVRISSADISRDGSNIAYSALDEGWAIINVVPTAGGTPRRLSDRTERVYQPYAVWSPDGSHLITADYVYEVDGWDPYVISWPAGESRRLAHTPGSDEFATVWTPDARNVIAGTVTLNAGVARLNVSKVLAEIGGN